MNQATTDGAPVPGSESKLAHVTITTDGGCWPNPGPGAWAGILRCGGHVKTVTGANGQATNNRMELTAIIESLRCLKTRARVTIRTDSMLCIWAIAAATIEKKRIRYERKGKNMDLVRQLWAECEKHEIETVWVKGHSGDPDNEACDKACTEAMRKAPRP